MSASLAAESTGTSDTLAYQRARAALGNTLSELGSGLAELYAQEYWTLQDIADWMGLPYSTVSTYRARQQRSSLDGRGRHAFPVELKRIGHVPVWRPEDVVKWILHERPGRGAGGGRPSHRSRRSSLREVA